jgi:hypothetical protein
MRVTKTKCHSRLLKQNCHSRLFQKQTHASLPLVLDIKHDNLVINLVNLFNG